MFSPVVIVMLVTIVGECSPGMRAHCVVVTIVSECLSDMMPYWTDVTIVNECILGLRLDYAVCHYC